MKAILRRIFVYTVSLFLTSLFLPGLVITGGFVAYVYAGALLALFSIVLDPIIKALTLPFNLLTLGLLSFLTILVSLFILTLFDKNIAVTSFVFQGFSFFGAEVRQISFGGILPIIVISVTIYLLNRIIDFIFTE